MTRLRLAFNTAQWKPTREEWLQAASIVQHDEQERVARFVFRKDAKSAMAGRLLIRRAIHDTFKLDNTAIKLERTERGKPYLLNTPSSHPGFSFNVSHQGSFAILASDTSRSVGVDVMKTEPPTAKNTEEFFSTMNRQFTTSEWQTIKTPRDDTQQLANFYRFWCLKESYVKAVGDGIGFSLQRLQFKVNSPLKFGHPVCDTELSVDGRLAEDWTFQESMLDDNHCVSVAVNQSNREQPQVCDPFTVLTFPQLVHSLSPLRSVHPQYWLSYEEKEEKPSHW